MNAAAMGVVDAGDVSAYDGVSAANLSVHHDDGTANDTAAYDNAPAVELSGANSTDDFSATDAADTVGTDTSPASSTHLEKRYFGPCTVWERFKCHIKNL